MLTLNLPQRKDPIARLTLLACAGLVLYAAFVSATAPQPASAQAEQDPIIILATPALPTPALAELPALSMPTPQTIYVEVPGPTPLPEVVYVQVAATAGGDGAQQPFVPPASPATQPDTPEFNAALADIYSDLPTIQCPCGVLETQPYEPMTEAEKAYSRARTR